MLVDEYSAIIPHVQSEYTNKIIPAESSDYSGIILDSFKYLL